MTSYQSLKPRVAQILKTLLQSKQAVPIKKLAEKFDVSSRTIRYDLDDLEDSLANYDVTLVRKPHVGIFLDSTEEKLKEVATELVDLHSYQRVLSPQERKYLILLKLLRSDEPIIIKQLEAMLEVSNSTVIKDLNKVEAWLEEYDLELIRKTNYGIELAGDEMNIRHAMTAVLEETADEEELISFLSQIQKKTLEDKRLETGFLTELDKLVGDLNLAKIEDIVAWAEKELGFQLADGAYAGLLVHLGLAISRLLAGKDIELSEERRALLQESPEYDVAQEVGEMIEEVFEVEVPISEIAFITLHLMGAKLRQHWDQAEYDDLADTDLPPELIMMTKEMVEVAEDYLDIRLSDDEQLMLGLALHLKPTINRLKYDLPLKNPLVVDVKEKYGEVFAAAKRAAKILQSELQKPVGQDEIGFLAMHLGAAIERRNSNQDFPRLRVALVCSSGIGTTNLLATKLKKEFSDIEIVEILSAFELRQGEVDLDEIDLLITTVGLEVDFCSVLEVNPLLSDSDKKRIQEFIEQKKSDYSFDSGKKQTTVAKHSINLETLLKIIERKADVKDKIALKKDLYDFLTEREIDIIDKGGNQQEAEEVGPELLELLTADTIKINSEVSNWQQAVEETGGILLNQDSITDNYIKESLESINNQGPYVVIAPGVSLLHAKPEAGVLKQDMALLVVPSGVEFGHKNDPVKLIFMLAPIDKSSHYNAMVDLLKLIDNRQLVDKITSFDNPESIIAKLKDMI
ncbi:BglG family transcription antiterminator [Halanaerobacter jeridensis]|uniref:Transcriptional antiterminator/mannitol/fructose-specific phosphotransferase system IIA component (Ntr-type) n=1 Tax=Halanaerobacter jeridensis TaxID=706427 RepID=A0A938XP18_9FIRM|nr:BglG family transcription antiterminator [Halanaerobacter jeridensis]MBM7556107.1 transcriptional antiterminator/mannitol/fructose-specific phosphotransferase system IIA component (Ntr-type) [Halanaerobacter jeridensis]